jgi:hypothetical protein
MGKNKLCIAAALALITGLMVGCGGGGSSSSHDSNSSIQGVETPSSVSVVTAQNASAGG